MDEQPFSRLVKLGKRYFVDSALAAAAVGISNRTLMCDSDLFGRMLDTFVMAQLRPECAVSSVRSRLYHARDKDGRHKVDIVVEFEGDHIICMEVKATAAPSAADARHLVWMRDAIGDRFVTGVVFHTGPRVFELAERIYAIPICALWGLEGSLTPAALA